MTKTFGQWIGHYERHFDQVVEIRQRADWIECVKITGDAYVPAGEVTWRVNLRTKEAVGLIAEEEFRNPRFVPVKITVLGRDKIKVTWEDCGAVEFRRDSSDGKEAISI